MTNTLSIDAIRAADGSGPVDFPDGATIAGQPVTSLSANISAGLAAAVNPGAGNRFLTAEEAAGGASASDQLLKTWTESGAYELTAITYDGTYSTLIASAVVKWPDGSAGALTVTAHDNTAVKETAYTITHTVSGKTVTQAAVTLNADGNITVKPALTVA